MGVVRGMAGWPLMSGEPALMVIELVKAMEAVLMSEGNRFLGMTATQIERSLVLEKEQQAKYGYAEAKERHMEQVAAGMQRAGVHVSRIETFPDRSALFHFPDGSTATLTAKDIAAAGSAAAVAKLAEKRRDQQRPGVVCPNCEVGVVTNVLFDGAGPADYCDACKLKIMDVGRQVVADRDRSLAATADWAADRMTLAGLERAYADWHGKKYGKRESAPYCPNGVILPASYAKLLEEVGELGEALMMQNGDEVAIEAADIIGILFNLVRGVGRSLPEAIVRKLDVLYKRLDDDAGNRGPIEVPMYGGNPTIPTLPGNHV